MKKLGLSQFITPNPNSTLFFTKDEEHEIEIYELPICGFEGKVVQLMDQDNIDVWSLKAVNLFKNIHYQLKTTNQIDKGLSLDEFKKLLLLENLEKIVFIDPLLKLQEELKKEIGSPQKTKNEESIFDIGYQSAQKIIKYHGIDYFIKHKISTINMKNEAMYIYLVSLAGWGIKQGSVIQQEIDKIFNETANLILSLAKPYSLSIHIDAQYLREQYLKLNLAKDYETAEEQHDLISGYLLNNLKKKKLNT